MIAPFLTIAESKKGGRGVFTNHNIGPGVIVEISPVIILTAKERKLVEETKLYNYIFEWGASRKLACVALGYVSMYNHSFEPNCEYEQDYKAAIMLVKTLRKIRKGEELLFSYNGDPENKNPLWFKTR